jgi:hypothetical protein
MTIATEEMTTRTNAAISSTFPQKHERDREQHAEDAVRRLRCWT